VDGSSCERSSSQRRGHPSDQRSAIVQRFFNDPTWLGSDNYPKQPKGNQGAINQARSDVWGHRRTLRSDGFDAMLFWPILQLQRTTQLWALRIILTPSTD
jgi:hypothetical protein